MLSAALASQKVGSAGWNQLITAIRAARAEEAAWLNSTPEGRAEHFSEVYGKVMDVFSAQEAILEMNNESATAANRKIIETLEKQIEVYERRASELQRDLDKIAEKEDEINKAYDEKTKALETVKKLNQDILNQQKSQLSIADALSQGDIGAAATAIQESRAQNAAAQGDAVGNALDASRQAQLNALTENGKTRAQIEAEIKQIKKDVAAIEFGSLQNARDAVTAADEALEKAKENLTVQGQSKTAWENINTQIDASKANAALYDAEVMKALENAKGLVGEWSKLQDTFTTTHVVNTVYNGTPSTTAPIVTALDPETARQRAAANRARAQYTSANGGYISGPGTGTSDSIPAMLSDGEYVIRAASVNKFGKNFLDAINAGRLPGFKLGGMLRDGGGSSKSYTPTNAGIARKTAAASGKPAASTQSGLERALPIILKAAQSMPIISDQIQGIEMGRSLVNLVTGKATGGDYATLGLGAVGFIPGGRIVSKLGRFGKGIRGLKPDVPKTQTKLPDLSRFTPKLPPGMQALIDDMAMVHRSMDPHLVTKHPGQVASYSGRTQGPGTYFYRNRKESLDEGWQYGGYTYQQKHTPLSALKTATSKGYLDFEKAASMRISVGEEAYNSKVIQDLIRRGYVGMKDPKTGIMTNWLTGTKGGPTLKKVGQEVGKLERFASMFNKPRATTNTTKKFDHVDTIAANQGRGYAPYTRIDRPGGIAAARANADERIRGLAGTYMGQYLGNAKSLYDYPEKMDAISRFFNLGDEFIPGGLEMYRIPSAGEVLGRLPTKVGDIYRPGKVTSAATSGDLQQLGQIFTDKTMATGGNQHLAQGIAQIFTRKPIPGIEDLTKFLSTKKLDIRSAKQSQFMKEYVLGPNTSYRVHNFTPGTRNTPASWTLEAFIEKFAKGGMVPKYFAAGGMVPKYFAAGGMVPKYFGGGGMAKKYAKGGDVVPSMLTPGEFVMNKNATAAYGPLLNSINSGSLSSLVGSGQLNKPVYNMPEKAYAPVGGSMPLNSQLNNASSLTSQDNSVYNYSLSVNVDGTNASPDQIANVVMKKLQGIDSQRVRRQVIR
jgi:hypothetical protein